MAVINLTEVTTGVVTGTGAFDKLMVAVTAHLEVQYKAGRLKGADYASVYLGALQSTLAQSTQFILGKQQADKQAELLVQQGASELKQNVTNGILDKQLADIVQATALKTEQVTASIANTVRSDAQSTQELLNKAEQLLVLTAQKLKIAQEQILITQKSATEEAQTLGSTTLGTNPGVVAGTIGKQQLLMAKQTDGFDRDAEQKALKIMMDGYAIRRSTNSVEAVPTKARDDALNVFIQKAATGMNLGTLPVT